MQISSMKIGLAKMGNTIIAIEKMENKILLIKDGYRMFQNKEVGPGWLGPKNVHLNTF